MAKLNVELQLQSVLQKEPTVIVQQVRFSRQPSLGIASVINREEFQIRVLVHFNPKSLQPYHFTPGSFHSRFNSTHVHFTLNSFHPTPHLISQKRLRLINLLTTKL